MPQPPIIDAPAETVCVRCKARILRTTGAVPALDPTPSPSGCVQLDGGVATILPKDVARLLRRRLPEAKLYDPHHYTCTPPKRVKS